MVKVCLVGVENFYGRFSIHLKSFFYVLGEKKEIHRKYIVDTSRKK